MVLAVAIDHPVFSVCADLQLEAGDVVGLLRFLRDGTLRGDACYDFQEVQVHLRERKSVSAGEKAQHKVVMMQQKQNMRIPMFRHHHCSV